MKGQSRRIWLWTRRWRQAWYGMPLFRWVVLLTALILLQSVLFWAFEQGDNPDVDNPAEALWAIMIFLFSGADVTPVTPVGRILAIVGIVEGMTLVSVLIASLTTLQLRGWKRTLRKMKDHIVVLGWAPRVRHLLAQLQTGDLKTARPVVLVADLPKNPAADLGVQFVSGDPTDEEALLEAGVRRAYGAVVLADLSARDPDARTLLIALAVEHLNPSIYTVVEVVDPRNVRHFQHANVDEVVCLNQFSEYLILQSLVSPGLSHLFRSLLEFGEGDEVYRVPAPPSQVGRSFQEALVGLYQRWGVILLAVERDGEIVVNPKEAYYLEKGDHLFVIAPEEPTFESTGGELYAV